MSKKSFTLLELCMICVVVALSGAIVTPKFIYALQKWELEAETRKVAAHLRQLQQQSKESAIEYYGIEVQQSNPNYYTVGYWNSGSNNWFNTSEVVTLGHGMRMSGISCNDFGVNSPFKLMFNRLGAPLSFNGWPQDETAIQESTCTVSVFSPPLSRSLRIDFTKYTGRLRIY